MSLSPVSDSSGEETVSEGGHEMSMSPVSDNGLSSSDSSGLEDNNASIPEDPAVRCTQFETRNNLYITFGLFLNHLASQLQLVLSL